MRAALTVLADELRRLKGTGVRTISLSDDALSGLKAAIAARRASAPIAALPPTAAAPRVAASAPVPAPKPEVPKPKGPPPPTVTLPAGTKAERWAFLKNLVVQDPNCRVHVKPGKQVVLGVGNLDAKIMFVGEAPGAEEEVQGEPFVGPAGQLLNKMIAAMGVRREEVYIGNIMNWRPELPAGPDGVQYGNRPPSAEEMAYCMPYLLAQVEIVAPAILVALGSTAAQGLLGAGSFKALGEVRGRWKEFSGRPLMITYHPSYILRNPVNRQKRLIWEDFLKVMARAELPVSDKQRDYFLEK